MKEYQIILTYINNNMTCLYLTNWYQFFSIMNVDVISYTFEVHVISIANYRLVTFIWCNKMIHACFIIMKWCLSIQIISKDFLRQWGIRSSPDSHTPDSSISYSYMYLLRNNCLEVLSYNNKRDNTLLLHCMIFQVTLELIMFL